MFWRIVRTQLPALHSSIFYKSSRALCVATTKAFISSAKQNIAIEQRRSRLYQLNQQNLAQFFKNHPLNFVELDQALEQLKTRYGQKSVIYTKKLLEIARKCVEHKVNHKAEAYMNIAYQLIKKYPKLERHFSGQDLQMQLANLCLSVKKYQQAIKFYSGYLSKYSKIQQSEQAVNKFICLTQLARIYAQLKNHQQTEKYLMATSQMIMYATKARKYQFDNLLTMDHQFSKALDYVVFCYQQGQVEKAEKNLQTFIELLNSSSFIYSKNLQQAQQRLNKIGIKNQYLQQKLSKIREQKKQKN